MDLEQREWVAWELRKAHGFKPNAEIVTSILTADDFMEVRSIMRGLFPTIEQVDHRLPWVCLAAGIECPWSIETPHSEDIEP